MRVSPLIYSSLSGAGGSLAHPPPGVLLPHPQGPVVNASPFRIVVIGASAGGVEALLELAAGLPADFAAPVFVVLHIPGESPSLLAELLTHAGSLRATEAVEGGRIERGCIYVAPPDKHLLIEPGRMVVRRGPRENYARPAVDPLFRSAAVAYGPNVIGVVLTGNLYDGSAGLKAIKLHGGTTIVQDPQEALFPSMPESAMRTTVIDHCLPLRDIAGVLREIAMPKTGARSDGARPVRKAAELSAPLPQEAQPAGAVPDQPIVPREAPGDADAAETRIASGAPDSLELLAQIAVPSAYTCPECNGALWQINDAGQLRFRCRVGHAFNIDSLLYALDDEVESALWSALRALEERATLNARAALRPEMQSLSGLVARFRERQEESERHAKLLRQLLESGVDKLSEE